MTPFIALYYGESPQTASVVAVSILPELVRYVVEYLLTHPDPPSDAVQSAIEQGRSRALLRLLCDLDARTETESSGFSGQEGYHA